MSQIGTNPIRIMLIEDHAVVRAGLRMLIESHPGLAVVGEAGTRSEALSLAGGVQPEIIILDLVLGEENALDFLPELLAAARQARVLLLTGVLDIDAHRRAFHLGASGVVLKEKAAEVLIKAIEKIHAGEAWLDRTMAAILLGDISHRRQCEQADPEAPKIATLTQREREVITLVAQGLNRKQIAGKLFISEATVRNHLTSILDKLELSDRFELAMYAYRHGLGRPPSPDETDSQKTLPS